MIPFGNVLWDSIYNQAIRKLHSPILTYLRPLHTRDWVPVTIPLHALALVGKVGPVQVRFTLHLRDQRSKRMQEGCKVYMDSYKLHGIMCHGHLDYFQEPSLGGRPNTKPMVFYIKRTLGIILRQKMCGSNEGVN